MPENTLTAQEQNRYSRQVLLSEIGEAGQLKLKAASILVIGAGGLGCPVLQYLAAAGIGTIGIVDDDKVDESNLHRQVIFGQQDVGKLKAEVAAQRLQAMNPNIIVKAITERLHPDNAFELLNDYDIVVDGSDNFPTRYLVNDVCVKLDKPFVSGSVMKFEGQVGVFNYKLNDKQCSGTYRCLFPEPPQERDAPDCATIGVIGVIPGLIGMLQANEVIKMITGYGTVLAGKLLVIDTKTLSFKQFSFKRNERNVANIKEAPSLSLEKYEQFCKGKSNNIAEVREITPAALRQKLKEHADLQLVDVREPQEHELINIGGDLLPMNEILSKTDKISRNKDVVVYCKVGQRSEWVIQQLQEKHGFMNLYNLKGGMRAFLAEK
jgi:adenylyltransferase/sulfurtransferase